ncbi:MAG: enoyl-CoA hydratase/isomerase family protein [Candidatus Thermoplasmatota archaeon]|nr:enoyl-CoA hydratase/isomerase family protein [Candidatus Thermoplasmatota archaeon]
MEKHDNILVEKNMGVATVTLNRPDVHNAFNDQVIEELHQCFKNLGEDGEVWAIILTGEGKSFCAGADLNWMKSMVNYSKEQNIHDSQKMADMFEAIYRCPKPVLGKINGSAFGGGLGLLAVCDYVISVPDALFAFSEVKLGIAPAVISPYILKKVAPGKARYLFISGERFGPEAAMFYGLVDDVAEPGAMDEKIQKKLKLLSSSGPVAVGKNKELVSKVEDMDWAEARKYTMELIAEMRTSPEGQEGIGAFLEKRKPEWSK